MRHCKRIWKIWSSGFALEMEMVRLSIAQKSAVSLENLHFSHLRGSFIFSTKGIVKFSFNFVIIAIINCFEVMVIHPGVVLFLSLPGTMPWNISMADTEKPQTTFKPGSDMNSNFYQLGCTVTPLHRWWNRCSTEQLF